MSLMRRLNNNQATTGRPPRRSLPAPRAVASARPACRRSASRGSRQAAGSGVLSGGTATTALKRPQLGKETANAPRSERNDSFTELKTRVQNRLIAELDPRMDLANADEVRRTVEETFNAVLEAEQIVLTRVERLRLFEAIAAEILGFGPIEPLLKDDTITEIMVNGPKQIYIERARQARADRRGSRTTST